MSGIATIIVHVPPPLRPGCGGAAELALEAATVRDALHALEREYPDLYRGVCDDAGAVRRHVNLFVNNDHIRQRDGLDTPLAPGDVLSIMPSVSGG
jgi:molybdopterin synthase sulfur carrier subunit